MAHELIKASHRRGRRSGDTDREPSTVDDTKILPGGKILPVFLTAKFSRKILPSRTPPPLYGKNGKRGCGFGGGGTNRPAKKGALQRTWHKMP